MIFFTKMHGLGNDYLFINCIDEKNKLAKEDIPKIARYLSNRNFGVGSDGIILINKSNRADFKMNIYNSDGSEAQMCGNGIRCFAKYVYENKMINTTEIKIETLCGIKTAYIVNSKMNENIQEIKVDMGEPIFEAEKIPVIPVGATKEKYELEEENNTKCDKKHIEEYNKEEQIVKLNLCILGKDLTSYCVSMGNPHAVIITTDIENIDIAKIGNAIENDFHFPEKTNVEFIQILDKASIKMRVWERGSGETFACGTGACASAVVCNKLGLIKDEVTVSLKGGDLSIQIDKNSNKVYMTGIATKVFDGYIEDIKS